MLFIRFFDKNFRPKSSILNSVREYCSRIVMVINTPLYRKLIIIPSRMTGLVKVTVTLTPQKHVIARETLYR